jgi:hypothetical protein
MAERDGRHWLAGDIRRCGPVAERCWALGGGGAADLRAVSIITSHHNEIGHGEGRMNIL